MILECLGPTYGLIWPPGKYFGRPDIFGVSSASPGVMTSSAGPVGKLSQLFIEDAGAICKFTKEQPA
jgi:hypothetical protein